MMGDVSVEVRDSVGWLLSRAMLLVPGLVLTQEYFMPLLAALMAGARMEPRIATNCCWVSALLPLCTLAVPRLSFVVVTCTYFGVR